MEQRQQQFLLKDSSSADSSAADSTPADSSDNTANADNTSFYVSEDPVELDEYDTSTSEDGAVSINLSDTGSSSDSDAVTIDASTVTITATGTYLITGTLSDGNVIVKAIRML